MGMALFTFVAPGMTLSEQSAVTRCRIALSQVVPVLPDLETEAPKHTAPPVRKATQPAKAQQRPMVPAVKKPEVTKPAAGAPAVNEPVRVVEETAMPETVEETAEAETVNETAVPTETQAVPSATEADAAYAAARPAPAIPMQAAAPVQSSKSYLNEHLAVIARLLQEHLYYPRMARKRHIEGEVLATFTVETDGTVHGVRVKKHARDILDRAAVKTIESLSGRLPHPKQALTLEVPIRFVLK